MKPVNKPNYETAFNYLIHQNSDSTWSVNFSYGGQSFGGPKGLKSYIECLKAVQLLQFNLTRFDRETLRVAESLKLDEAA